MRHERVRNDLSLSPGQFQIAGLAVPQTGAVSTTTALFIPQT